jgi:hypothetical protein
MEDYMKTVALFAAAMLLAVTPAFADDKPSEAEAKKIAEAIAALGCSGGEMEKEGEASGYYEVDDAKCKDGQFDIKLDKDFKLISMSRD